MYDFLYTLGIVQSSVVAEALEDIYFYDWQIGSQEDMTPGLVDVSISMQLTIPVQGDASCCSIVSVDLKTKVAFQYMLLIPKCNCYFQV